MHYNPRTCTTQRWMTETCTATTWYTNHLARNSSKWGSRPYSLAEIIYEYDTEDEGQRGYQRDSQDHFHENHSHPLHQYIMYREDGGRRRCVLTDTGDELVYLQCQPGLQLEEGNWLEYYNCTRPGQSSIRDEDDSPSTIHPGWGHRILD